MREMIERPYGVSATLTGAVTPIRSFLGVLQERKAREPDLNVILMCQGDVNTVPHANGPEPHYVSRNNARPYAAALAEPWFQDAYESFTNRVFGQTVTPANVIATHGGEHASVMALSVLSGRVILESGMIVTKGVWYAFSPGYPGYITAADNAGVTLRWIPRSRNDAYAISPDVLDALKEQVARDQNAGLSPIGIIVATPGNPDCHVMTYTEIDDLSRFAEDHGMVVAYDIPYALFAPSHFVHPYAIPRNAEVGIIWDSGSKLGHICGHRAGAMVVPPRYPSYFRQYCGLGSSRLSQASYLSILKDPNIHAHAQELQKWYGGAIDAAVGMLSAVEGMTVNAPGKGNVTPYLLVNDALVHAKPGGAAALHRFLAEEYCDNTETVCIGAPWMGRIGLPGHNGLVRFALIHKEEKTRRGLRAYLSGRAAWLEKSD